MKGNNQGSFKRDFIIIGIIIVIVAFFICMTSKEAIIDRFTGNSKTLKILSSYENKLVEDEIIKYAKSLGKKVEFIYQGDLDIIDSLNNNSAEYDAVWISNSMWLYMLDNSYLTSNSKSISISPIVFGIKKNKANELGLVNSEVTNEDMVNLIRNKKINYVMSSVTQTNSGATAYLGFLSSLAGNPEILTEDMLKEEQLINNLTDMFSGVKRVSGDEKYLEEMFLNSNEYDAVVASESSLININQNLKEQNKEQLYLIYPKDGVAINDSTFAFIANSEDKEELFLEIQSYLLSNEGQKMLEKNGQRTWYGGVSKDSDKTIFNPDWGIDTNQYLNVTKFPSKKVITSAINLYIEQLRKPTHVVFCLDYSGSMSGEGQRELTNAMEYILDYEQASSDKLQFSEKDKITVITFSTEVEDVWTTNSGYQTDELITNIREKNIGGSTALYDAINKGLDILDSESDDYTKTIIAMTDGYINVGSFNDVYKKYHKIKSDVPIYGITFGNARIGQLNQIAQLANSKVFDGKTDLLKAFKEVRGYN